MRRKSSKGSVALFLGAGSSSDFGYPLTRDLFPSIREKLLRGKLFDLASNRKRERAKMRRLSDYLERLMPAVFSEAVELPWITEVLSLVDHFLQSQQIAAPRFTLEEMRDFRTLLEEAILAVITAGQPNARDLPELHRLTDWILCAPETAARPVTVISTNYDTLVESLLFEKIIRHAWLVEDNKDGARRYLDFGFAWREHERGTYREELHRPPQDPWVRILKLHGSLNWLSCPLCGFTYLNTSGDIHGQAFREARVDRNNTCVCGHGPVRAVIVAPSMVRAISDPNLLSIWSSALESLRRADEWIFAGYSLPSEDIAIRSILVRAFHGRGNGAAAPRVRVVQLKPDKAMEGRYRLLFPQATFEYGGFKRFIAALPDPPRHYRSEDT